MKLIGAKGGRARHAGVAEQLPERERASLRERLRDKLDHETVIAAIERALAGGNESARVAAVKFLADLELYKREDEKERDQAAEYAAAAEKFEARVRDRAARLRRSGKGLVDVSELTQAARELWAEGIAPTGVVVADVSSADARATLQGLVDCGLIRPPFNADELDEKDAEIKRLLAEKDAEIARLKTQLSELTVAT